ncbi:MAG: hypothetical protein E6Q36_09320 [Chryseobacterium sp.]|nr:MAG: hypothetical protein E6Q36_09320 [Chryseobacterium sp.]
MKKQTSIIYWSIWYIVHLLVLLLMLSCSPIKRLERFEKRHPYLFESIKDTVVIKDTILLTIPAKKADSTTNLDTFLNQKHFNFSENGINVDLSIDNNRKLNVKATTDPETHTIPYEKTISVNRYAIKPPPQKTFWQKIELFFIWAVWILFFVVVIYQLTKAISNKNR